jgi:hypothetical protein
MVRFATATTLTMAMTLMLGACSGSRVVSDNVSTAYSPLEFSAAASGRDLATEVYGNPFPIDQTSFDQTVTDLMQGKHFGPPTHFTTTPNDSANRRYKVVMVFNPSENIVNTQICSGGPIATNKQPGQPIRLQAAFCRGGTLTSTNGWAPALTSPQDTAFRSLISDTTFELFPLRDPNHNDSNCGFNFNC